MCPVPGLVKDTEMRLVPRKIYGAIDTSDTRLLPALVYRAKFNKRAPAFARKVWIASKINTRRARDRLLIASCHATDGRCRTHESDSDEIAESNHKIKNVRLCVRDEFRQRGYTPNIYSPKGHN